MAKTLFEKIWDEHVVADLGGGANLLYVDRHYLHELCVSRGFPTLHERGLSVRNPDLTFAAPDHVISSAPRIRARPRVTPARSKKIRTA